MFNGLPHRKGWVKNYPEFVDKPYIHFADRGGGEKNPKRTSYMEAPVQKFNQAFAGDICAFFGLDCASGDSFVLDKSQTLSMESIHVPEPVISMSIKPQEKKHADNFAKAVARFTKEDPTYKVLYLLTAYLTVTDNNVTLPP